jgi:integral membrane protein (TIGR01906 family)
MKKFTSVLFAVAVFFLIITFAIRIPIDIRPVYYAHINAYDLPEYSGYSYEEIREAYDEVLDYLTKPGAEFGTGKMEHSVSGAKHFTDCKKLFALNYTVFYISAIAVGTLIVLKKMGKTEDYKLGRFSSGFWGALAAIVVPMLLALMVCIDFDSAFYVFHFIFFPGNEDWIFDPRYDEIINVMPPEFFMNCGIIIGAVVLLVSSAIIITELAKRK